MTAAVSDEREFPRQKNLRNLSDGELLERTTRLVREERELTLEVLNHLREISDRDLHLKQGYSSLHDYATRALGYSTGAAHRRIESMRLLTALPEDAQTTVEAQLQSGALHLSTVSQVQGFLKNERKQNRHYSATEKHELMQEMVGASARQVEAKLASISPESVPGLKERLRPLGDGRTEVRFQATSELLEKLERVKDLCGGKNAYPDVAKVFELLADFYLAKKDPQRQTARKNDPRSVELQQQTKEAGEVPTSERDRRNSSKTVSSESSSKSFLQVAPTEVPAVGDRRTVSVALKRVIWQRARGHCEYKALNTRCLSQRNLEIDHVHAWALGGKTELRNLQLLCREHHRAKV